MDKAGRGCAQIRSARPQRAGGCLSARRLTSGLTSSTVCSTGRAEAMSAPNTLAAHPCFKTLDPGACRVLDRQCLWLKTPAGAWLVDQSAHDRDVYFIMSGHLRA